MPYIQWNAVKMSSVSDLIGLRSQLWIIVMIAEHDPAERVLAYTSAQVRVLDDLAITRESIPGIVLMRRAGEATLQSLLVRWPDIQGISVICGAGNNAGDGYIIAGLAAMRGLATEVRWVVPPEKLKGDASKAWQWAIEQGVSVAAFTVQQTLLGQVIVDALLGTGLNGAVRESYQLAIDQINASGLPVVSVDIPSGINADTGSVMGSAVSADLTVTFIGLKRGLFTAEGKDHAGELNFSDLGVPASIYSGIEGAVEILDLEQLKSHLVPRRRNAHKGDFGHLLLVGGDLGMPGSIAMASAVAARAGAGLVSVATRPEHMAPLITNRPEAMVHGIESGQELESLLADGGLRYQAMVIGPGLGQSAWSQQMLQAVLRCQGPLVVDADGLNLVARMPPCRRDNWILTPHPGEAARLLGVEVREVQGDRFGAVRALQEKFGGVALLKGAGTLIAADHEIALCPYGNPGMASGGMGDVLTGVIGALIAQGLPIFQAACLGACLHARAADLQVASYGEVGLLATDLYEDIRALINFPDLE
jgi:hydroxyethylthiazole kinase-like uncharacterized protein yjeF